MTHLDDCELICTGCNRRYCDIKEEEDFSHDKELPETFETNAGEPWCHADCYRDAH